MKTKPVPPSDLPRQFGPYVLLRRLAVGGMAEVYVASTEGSGGFQKLVALKLIHPRHSQDQNFISMLIEEAKLSVQLNHQNIVQTFDLGCIEGTYFIVMEHVEGYDAHHTLKSIRARNAQLPVDLAAYVVAEVCQGLDYAHRRQDHLGRPLHIVHRDVSPQNVLLSFAGEVKIGDFGIAKVAYRGGEAEAGVIKGKYFYMSPEQAWGDPVDHRSDIFSAGVMLWELLAGETLYKATEVRTLLRAVRKANISPPSDARSAVPSALDEIVARATATRRDARYSDAGEFLDALHAFLADQPLGYAPGRLAEILEAIPPPPEYPDAAQAEIPDTAEVEITNETPLAPREPLQGEEFRPRGVSVLSDWRAKRDDLSTPALDDTPADIIEPFDPQASVHTVAGLRRAPTDGRRWWWLVAVVAAAAVAAVVVLVSR